MYNPKCICQHVHVLYVCVCMGAYVKPKMHMSVLYVLLVCVCMCVPSHEGERKKESGEEKGAEKVSALVHLLYKSHHM